ncbi:MAG: oligosaccharide flippase family protein, partial [Halobacteriaceae archaeon]
MAFIGSIYLARVLGPSGYGKFYLITAVISFLDNPVTGWASACKKRLTEADFPEDEAVGSLILSILLASTIVLIVVRLTLPIIQTVTDLQIGWLLLGVLFVGNATFRSLLQILKGTNKFGSSPWIVTMRDILRVLLQAGLVLMGFGVAGMVWGMAIASIVLSPVILYLSRIWPVIPSKESIRHIWTFAKSSIPLGVLGSAKGRMDILILGGLAGTAAVGNYEIALKLTMPAVFIASVAGESLVGRVSNLQSRSENYITDIKNTLSYASIFALPLLFGAIAIGNPLVQTIYGNEFTQAGTFITG